MKLTVKIVRRNNDAKEELAGTVSFDGSKITGDTRPARWVAATPIMLKGGAMLKPTDDPERFMRELCVAYHGSRMWAMKARIAMLAVLAVSLIGMAATATAQEVRRAVPVEIRKAIPVTNETCWQWLKRTGNCTTGGCEDGDGDIAYMNWGDDTAPVYDNVEIEPEETLVSSFPFREPSPSEPFYDERAEESIRVHDSDNGWIVSRMFRRGVFIGYVLWRPEVPTLTI